VQEADARNAWSGVQRKRVTTRAVVEEPFDQRVRSVARAEARRHRLLRAPLKVAQ
jgi:hypothetical protein